MFQELVCHSSFLCCGGDGSCNRNTPLQCQNIRFCLFQKNRSQCGINLQKLISHCNSRFEVKTKSSGGSGALKEPAIGGIELSDSKLDISDIGRGNYPVESVEVQTKVNILNFWQN